MKFKAILLCVFSLLLCSCMVGREKERAEAVVFSYHYRLQQNDLEGLLNLFSKDFFHATPREKMSLILKNINAKLGKFQSFTLSTWNVKANMSTAGSGRIVTLVYDVKYEKQNAVETFVLVEPFGSDSMLIQGFDIRSDAFL